MSDMDDIDQALSDGMRAVESLSTWVHNANGRDRIKSYESSIASGIKAFAKLRTELRNGYKHVEPPDDYIHTTCYCAHTKPPCSWCCESRNEDKE